MLARNLFLLPTILLTANFSPGCATVEKPTLRIVCATIQEYSADQQRDMHREYVNLISDGNFPGTIRLVDDYGVLRKRIRACQGERE